jgi:soluble cytochrome b562
LVAVGLAVVDSRPSDGPADEKGPAEAEDEVATLVATMSVDDLRAIVLDVAARDDAVRRSLLLRRPDENAVAELVKGVRDALATRGFIDYRRSFELAAAAEEILDELEEHLDRGAADAVAPALQKVTVRLQRLAGQADDSGGVIGDACQRAVSLYARSCREGAPDRTRLARWLVKFRGESPGWPRVVLDDFVAAFDEKALTEYRRGIESLARQRADADAWARREVVDMLVELADHDGDVDAAITLLAGGERVDHAGIVERLRAAGRVEEMLQWLDRAVAAGKVRGHGPSGMHGLLPYDVAQVYRSVDRIEDALDVLRAEFAREPGIGTFRLLTGFADEVGRRDAERDWALATARAHATTPYRNGAALIEIAIAEDDLDLAWQAEREFGAGYSWEPLVGASADSRPLDAARLLRSHVDEDLRHADTKRYPVIAERLVQMRELHEKGGAVEPFVAYLAVIRESYRRRPSLMAALDRARLI